jgi:hypothetical protein
MKSLIILDISTNNKEHYDRHNRHNSRHGNKHDNRYNSIGGGVGGKNKRKKIHNETERTTNSPLTYDKIVDLLIKGQKLRYQYPNTDLCCNIDSDFLIQDQNQTSGNDNVYDSEIYRILASTYDRIIKTNISDRSEHEMLDTIETLKK